MAKYDMPWETPEVQAVINIFGGTVANIKPLNQVELGGRTDNDDEEIQR